MKNNKFFFISMLALFSVLSLADDTLDSDFHLASDGGTTGILYMPFDAGGFSDWWYWGASPRHEHLQHEMLSGEYAAAIYYDGIRTEPLDPNNPSSENHAMWLTDWFSFPSWQTNSTFSRKGDPDCWFDAWNDPNNKPVNGINTAQSIIVNDDGRVRVTIDYEVVDLGEDVDLDKNGSPLAFWIANPNDPYNIDAREHYFVYSDRYILLQTYTITNIDPNESTLEDIEFYQMLHGHPVDKYGAVVTSTYDNVDYWKDCLSYYIPYNPIHCAKDANTVGNFRYDITQWNDGDPETEHVDWESFSSVIEPNWIECDYYAGHTYWTRPPSGTHNRIEDRILNNIDYSHGEVAGAMGWYLGSLDPNESISHTIAIMFGSGPVKAKPDIDPAFSLSKTDDVNGCASPCEDVITYTIGYRYLYNNPLVQELTFAPVDAKNATLIDYLPYDVDFLYADPNNGYYDSSQHAYVWYIGDVSGGDSDELNIVVQTNDKVIPGGEIENKLVVYFTYSNIDYSQEITHITDVCECGDCTDIVYVDKDATSGNNDGTSWADAYLKLEDALANSDMCNQIWVAEGIYALSTDPYTLKNGVGVYGGFDATETSLHERDWMNNNTILDGYDGSNYADYIITADPNTRWALLDGFIIKNGEVAGIFIDNGTSIQLEHNRIESNGAGVLCDNAIAPLIRNNFIYNNVVGMYFEDSESEALILNNTIAENTRGIHTESGTEPQIANCIFWSQTADANDLIGCYATYSCIEFPQYIYDNNDPNIVIDILGEGNIDDNPLFETGGYHLTSISPCIDAGDPDRIYDVQRDIDREFRVLNGLIEMGADEYCDSTYTTDSDFNDDNLVNLGDFAELSSAWLTYSNDPNYNSDCDINSDNEIDLEDFIAFVEDWLWMSCSQMTEFLLDGEEVLSASSMQSMSKSMLSIFDETTSLMSVESDQTQKDLEEHIVKLEDTIIVLETIWAEDEEIKKVIDIQDWSNFMNSVYKAYKDSKDN